MAGVKRVMLAVGLVVLALVVIVPAASAATPAVAYQLNQSHSGTTSDAVTTASSGPKELWGKNLGGPISYPLLADGHVYVTVANTSGAGTTLVALNPATGALVWGPKNLGGTYSWSGLAFDNNKVFTVNYDGVMEAFNASSGALLWATQLTGQYGFTSPPTAENGYVYTGGAGTGGTVYAVNETTGAVVWTAPVENGDHSSPAVSSSGVWVSYACGQTYDFNPTSGALIWHRDTDCEGGGGKTPVLDGNVLFVRDFSFPAILNASTGNLLAPFTSSGPAPAATSAGFYDLQGSTLTATSFKTGSEAWTFTGDGTLDSAPLVAGGTVLIGGSSGELYGLNAATGAQEWSINVGSAIPAPDEQNVTVLTGLATAAGLIVVPTASGELEAFK